MSLKSKYRSGYRKSSKKGLHIALIACMILFLCAIAVCSILLINYEHKQNTEVDITEDKKITFYTANTDIERGQIITASMLSEHKAVPNMPDDYYFSLDSIGRVAIVDVPEGMILVDNMCQVPLIDDSQREVECEIIALSDNLMENDSVDVRLMLPNGEDYIVLAKKSVHDLMLLSEDNNSSQDTCYLWLSEDEILYYSAAIVDAYLYSGASLYTTKYIEPTIQEPSIVTYVPSLSTITMMRENPNIVKEAIAFMKEGDRKKLENRLTDYLNKDVREVIWGETTVVPSEQNVISDADVLKTEESINPINDSQEASVFVDDFKEDGP